MIKIAAMINQPIIWVLLIYTLLQSVYYSKVFSSLILSLSLVQCCLKEHLGLFLFTFLCTGSSFPKVYKHGSRKVLAKLSNV